MLALALLALSLPSYADTVALAPGPRRKPLFVQLYRQSVYAAARYVRGADTFDAELSPGATAELTVGFTDEGEVLRIALSRPEGELAAGTVPFPTETWDILTEVEKARQFASALAKRIPVVSTQPASIATDLARARLAYEAFDLTSMVWLADTLGAAQRGRAGSTEAVKLMSAAHAWTGRWLSALPTARAKLFQARALAYAALSRGDPELALALAHCGRPADALFVLSRSTPDGSELARVAETLARLDAAAARSRARGSRQWLWTLALTAEYPGNGEESQATLKVLASSSPVDLAALHYWTYGADVTDGHAATERYLALPFILQRTGDFLDGRRVKMDEEADLDSASFQALVDGLTRGGSGDPGEEVPRSERASILLDAAVDAVVLRQEFLVRRLGSPQAASALAAEARPLSAHPWGFAIPLIRQALEQDQEAGAALKAGLAEVPISNGGLLLLGDLFRAVPGFSVPAWAASRDSELEDIASDMKMRALVIGSEPAMVRLAELAPYDSCPYERREDAVLDVGLAKLGERPGLLGYKLANALQKRPRSAAAIAAAADRLLAVSPTNQEALDAKASLLLYQGQPLEAAELWRKLVRARPDSLGAAQAAARMAWAYSVAGQNRRARQVALAAAPAYSYMNLGALGRTLEDTGRFDLAEKVYLAMHMRYEQAASRNLLGRFYMRTGDPRGHGLVHAAIPRFMKHQTEPDAVLTDDEHIGLLHAFLMTGEWAEAFHLLNTVLVPRWHNDDPRYLLWLLVTGLKSEQASHTNLIKSLSNSRDRMAEGDPLTPVVDAFLQTKTPEQAAAELDLDPDERTLGLFMLAQYWTHVRADPAKAAALLEATVALKRYENTSYYLALKALGRMPSYPQRVQRQLQGLFADLALLPHRTRRWLKERHGTKR